MSENSRYLFVFPFILISDEGFRYNLIIYEKLVSREQVRLRGWQKEKRTHEVSFFSVSHLQAKSRSYIVYLAIVINQVKSKLYIPQIQVRHS